MISFADAFEEISKVALILVSIFSTVLKVNFLAYARLLTL